MNYIVLDLEWNQACDSKTKKESPLLFEIVEIGAIKLNKNREQTDVFHELIKPQVYQSMNQITGELIHLNIEELADCRTFKEVATDFLTWCGEDAVFCTWGDLDLFELQRNLDFYKLPPLSDKPIPYYDIQKLFSIAYEDKKKRRTLAYAIDYLQIEKKIAFHRADSDAYYTAKVMEYLKEPELYTNLSYDIYHVPKTKEDEVKIIFNDYEKYISRAFEDRTEIMQDKDIISTRCYLCGKSTKKKADWFTMNNGKHYYAISHCEKHGYLKGKIRIRKNIENHAYVVKTMKVISKEEVDVLLEKKEQAKVIRKEREKRIREQKKKKL